MKRIYGLVYYDYAIAPEVSQVMYAKVEDAYKHLQETGYTERLEPLVYKNNKTLEIAEISIFELKM